MNDWIWTLLDVNPEPWAVGPVGIGRRGGKMYGYIGRNQQLHAYKEAVKEQATQYWNRDMIEGKLELSFFFWRRRDEYVTSQARTHRKHDADGTNLAKATEDALQGVMYKNDKDVIHMEWAIIEQGPEVRSKVVVGVRQWATRNTTEALLPWQVCELLNKFEVQSDLPEPDRNAWPPA